MVFLISLGHWANFFLAVFRQIFGVIIKTPSKKFSSVVKTAFYVSTGIVWEELSLQRKLFVCFHNFLKFSELFTAFRQTFFGRVDQTAFFVSRIQRNTLRRKKFFRKVRFFMFGPWWEIFQPPESLSELLFSVHRNNLRKNSFSKAFFIFCSELKSSIGTFGGKILFSLKKNVFSHQRRLLVEPFSAFTG